MHKLCKNLTIGILTIATTLSATALAGCNSSFTPLKDGPSAEATVSSNGGFVVEKGDYFYFINGVDTYTSDNTYGDVVKAALMRISKTDLSQGKNTAQIVIPSLMVAADYTSGIYIYGDRIYYATPNNVKNTQGEIETDYLDFKSAKLDGSDVTYYFRVSDNSTVYRYVQDGDSVYLLYVDSDDLHSYNTSKKEDVTLVKDMESYVLNSNDKTDPNVYYTMTVVDGDDKDSPNTLKYTQVYRVSASTTEAPYLYKYDQDYLDDNDNVAPYLNLGTIVLDGIGQAYAETPTQYTHDLSAVSDAIPTIGYTYGLTAYTNEGIYFTRTDLTSTGSTTGESGALYYLAASKLTSTWNSVTGNNDANFSVVAQDTTYASTSAIFYIDSSSVHHYLYVDGSSMYRADVASDGSAITTRIARDVSGATLMYLDSTSDSTYSYVYFNRSSGNGLSVERAVYNGTSESYSNLDVQENYQPVVVLDVEHASSWYSYEVIDGYLFYADSASLGSNTFNYVNAVNLNENGKLMTNSQIEAFNDKYNEVNDYITDLSTDQSALSTAINCYYYTGVTTYYDDNLAEAKEAGKADEYLYSADEQTAFSNYVAGKDGENDLTFKDYRLRSDFITVLGEMSETDQETYDDYWHTTLQKYTEEEEEDSSLPVWAWVLIGIAIAVVVAAAVLIPIFVIRHKKHKQAEEPKEPKMVVDTTDDKSVDVYADNSKAETTDASACGAADPKDVPAPACGAADPAEAPAPA